MIPIEIDWNSIKAEYIGGGISQRKLADKYKIPVDILLKRANREKWKSDREKASNKAATKAQQKVADAAAANATIAQDLKKRLLLRIQRTEAAFPLDATEVKATINGKTVIYRLRDLTTAYRDVTEDMETGEAAGSELLQSLMDLERGVTHD